MDESANPSSEATWWGEGPWGQCGWQGGQGCVAWTTPPRGHPPATPPALSFSALYPPALPGNLEQNEALSRHALNAGSHAALLSAPLPKSLLLHRQALSALSASHRTVGSLCCDSLCWVTDPPSEPQVSLVRGPDRSSASHLPAASLCPEIIACIVSRLPS